jgi:CO/xanthine dehydrogenase FAD-binding subunit
MDVLVGGPASKQRFDLAAQAALDSVELRASKYRASRKYREQMVRTWLPEILRRAVLRAKGAGS